MKKLIMLIAAIAMTVMATAQTVKSSKLFENTSVTLLGGGATSDAFRWAPSPYFWDGSRFVINGIRPLVGLEFDKYVTPVVGFGVEALAFFETNGSCTWVDQSNLLINGKLNFSNWFGGYKGYPRRVEVVGVAGLGWGHDYGNVIIDPNYVVYNTGAEVNVNLGEKRAWMITVRPTILWNNYDNIPTFNWGADARVSLQVGVTYKFGSKAKNSHNFVLCPYRVHQEDYDALLKKYNELASREPEVKIEKEIVKDTVKTGNTEKEIVKDTVKEEIRNAIVIYFDLGKSVISDRELTLIEVWARNLSDNNAKIKITGSADTKTGAEPLNLTLAQKRADTVKEVLVHDFGFNPDNITTEVVLDIFENPVSSRAAVIE